jgi:8-oxo-dGTP diphosphatase
MSEVSEPVRAAGAVLWRPGTEGPEVALVHRPKYDDWTFPKGKAKDGEHVLCTAVREVWEETGTWPVLGRRLPPREYVAHGRPKIVDYWAAVGTDGDFAPNAEVDRLDWLPLAAAEDRLSYAHDTELLREFAEYPRQTMPYIVLRHTSAGDKHDWAGDDLLRPLDQRGRTGAERLADVLSVFGPVRVSASATARCVETVLPYASRMGAGVHADWAFTVGRTRNARDRVAELIAARTPALVCTHGELVAELIGQACDELGAEPLEDARLAKGGFWVLHTLDGSLVSAERHEA